MRKLIHYFFFILIFTFSGFYFSQAKSEKNFLIIFQADPSKIKEIEKTHFFTSSQFSPNFFKVHFSSQKEMEVVLKRLKKDRRISKIEAGEVFKVLTTPNDPYYSTQWALPKIAAPSAWEMTTGSSSNVIAIIDTGVDYTHPDLDGKIWTNPNETVNNLDDDGNGYVDDIKGWDFVSNDNDPKEEAGSEAGHGTAIAGIAAAETNNSSGIAGIDWQAKIIILRAMAPQGTGDPDDVANAIRYAADKGAKVINLSIGSPTDWSVVRNAVDYAWGKGSLLVAASGNDGIYRIDYPAAYSNVLAVGSSNSSDQRSSFSNYGPELDLLAPGENIYTTFWQSGYSNSYASVSGTSASVSFVSGLASLIWAKYPSFSNSQIKERIISSADKVSAMGLSNFTNEYGYGRINLFRSLLRLVKGSSPPVYLISLDGTTKHHLENPEVFSSWGFDWDNIETLSDTEINNFSTGVSISFILKGSPAAVYLVDQGKRKWILDPNIFLSWGFDWGKVAVFSDIFVNGFLNEGEQISYLAKGSGSEVYFMDQGQKKHILDPNIFSAWGFSWQDVAPVSDCFLNTRGTGHYITYLVKGSGPNVYFMKDGKKMHIQSLETFNNLRFNWSDVVTIRDEFLWNIPFGPPINRLVKGSSPAVYLLENGKKRHITSLGAFRRMGFRWEDVAELPDPFIWGIPEGAGIY